MIKKYFKIQPSVVLLFFLIFIPLISYIISSGIDAGVKTIYPRPVPQGTSTVAIVKDNNVNIPQMVKTAVELVLGGTGLNNLISSGDTVLIKPNIVTSASYDSGIVTDWRVVQAIVNLAWNAGASQIYIGDSSDNNTLQHFIDAGYTSARFPNCTFVDFNNEGSVNFYRCQYKDGLWWSEMKIPAIYLDADVVITVPKMKTHGSAGITMSLKNQMGLPPNQTYSSFNDYKNLLHDVGPYNDYGINMAIICENMPRLPDLIVTDGIIAMEGTGPTQGTKVTMNLILAAKDPVAHDTVGTLIMDIEPYRIVHLVLAENENLGIMDISRINVVGQSIESVKRTFVRSHDIWGDGNFMYRATIVTRPTDSSVTVDGNPAEWTRANKTYLNSDRQVSSGASNWTGPNDLSAEVMTMYDTSNFYIFVSVKDDNPMQNPRTGNDITEGDCVVIYFSTENNPWNPNETRTYDSDDYKIGISYATTPVIRRINTGTSFNAQVAIQNVTGGYNMEIRIPWSSLGNMNPNASSYVQRMFDIGLNDSDTGNYNDTRMIWNRAIDYPDRDVNTYPCWMGITYFDGLNNEPVARAGDDKTVTVGQQITFDGSSSYDSDGSISTYSWDFDASNGIGQDATGPIVNYTYSTAKTYTVTLTVTDNKGATGTDTLIVNVTGGSEPTVTVLSPNGGQTWTVGTVQTVTWTWTQTVGPVNIDLSTNGGNNWINLVQSTPNDGSQTVTVPDTPSTSCRIRVGETDGTPSDTSDSNFTIIAPVITVISPNGGETWAEGTVQTVTWTWAGSVGNVNIDLSTNNGSSWTNLVSNTNNDGNQTVTVPSTVSTTCLIRVRETDGTPSDVSDAVFSIVSAQTPTITVLSPNGGEQWTVGTTKTVTWTWTQTVGNVNIDLSTNGGNNWTNLVQNTANDGNQTVTVPNTPSTSCRIRVRETDGTPSDSSDSNFTISAPVGPKLTVSQTSIDFGEIPFGQTDTKTFTITNTGGGTLTGTITAVEDWIDVSPVNFTGETIVNVTVDNSILQAREGEYTGTVSINSNGGNADITITLTATCVLVRPNPYNPDDGVLVFYGSGIVPQKTQIKIYSIAGEIIADTSGNEFINTNKEIYWSGKDRNGKIITPGIYIYTYNSPLEKGTGKFTVIK